MAEAIFAAICLLALFALAMNRAPLRSWALAAAIFTLSAQMGLAHGHLHWPVFPLWSLLGWLVAGLLFAASFPEIKRKYITLPAYRALKGVMPSISETEREALQAGTVGWDAELFSGTPDWAKLRRLAPITLTAEERAFLDGPTEELCKRLNDWRIRHELHDIPDDVWRFVCDNGFLGMLISKEHGGLGFSAQAQSLILGKISSRSPDGVTIVMVPNSLGPGELLISYGTKEQKDYYLPRLASAEEIPCFALTEPNAGSDAGGMQSYGVVTKGTYEGKEVIGMRLTWSKRYITLGPVATLLGLAFRLYDPEHLLGDKEDLGITCALIPTSIPGVDFKRRHDPLGVPFMNGPTTGENVFVPVDFIVGGPKMAGQGWRMLMQCLSAGRGISLPSLSAGAMKLATRTTGAYATIREQFGLPLGRFEGIQESMARIAGLTYAIDAVRSVTAAAVDAGEHPSVVSAIAKCYSTESMRKAVNDSMDILAGAGISMGPKNVMGCCYQQLPIGITVEGANILTRTMIVFGQGALRCHPHAQHEVRALAANDVATFDREFFGHIGFVFQTLARTKLLAHTNGAFASSPIPGPMAKYFKRLSRMAAAFSTCADFAMGTLGGDLKRKERLTGRLADAFGWLYIASTVLKKYVDEGQTRRDLPYAQWACEHALYEIQEGLNAFIQNMPNRAVARALRIAVFPWGRRYAPPSDRIGMEVAEGILEGREPWKALTVGIHVPSHAEPGLGEIESALEKILAARPVQKAIKVAIKERKLDKRPAVTLLDRALRAGVIGEREHAIAVEAEKAREQALIVDAFDDFVEASKAVGEYREEVGASGR